MKNEWRVDGWMAHELEERNTGSQGSDIDLCAIDSLRNAKSGAGSAFSTFLHSQIHCAFDLYLRARVSWCTTDWTLW